MHILFTVICLDWCGDGTVAGSGGTTGCSGTTGTVAGTYRSVTCTFAMTFCGMHASLGV